MTEWLAAIALHSTLWLGLAWLLLRVKPQASAKFREVVWATALGVSVLTPTVQAITQLDIALWQVQVPNTFQTSDGDHLASPGSQTWSAILPYLWIAVSYLILRRRNRGMMQLENWLSDRSPVHDAQARTILSQLCRRAGMSRPPRLTQSDRLGSPIAWRSNGNAEICIPTRAFTELDLQEMTALLGHEVAHHMRRDPQRLQWIQFLQAVFFFQPLFRIAARELNTATEEICDDWAVAHMQDRFAMASCLAEVAGWVSCKDQGLQVPCMGRRVSVLETRVNRLLENAPQQARNLGMVQAVALLTLMLIAPFLAPALALNSSEEVRHTDAEHYEHGERRNMRAAEHGEHRNQEHVEQREH